MAEGRRYSFDDAKARRARELEDELSLQRQVIRGEARQQIADIQRAKALLEEIRAPLLRQA